MIKSSKSNISNFFREKKPKNVWNPVEKIMFIMILLALVIFGYSIVINSESVGLTLMSFGLVFLLSHVVYRVFYGRKSVDSNEVTQEKFEVRLPKPIRFQLLAAFCILTFVAVFVFGNINLFEQKGAAAGVTLVGLWLTAFIVLLPVLTNNVSVSASHIQFKTHSHTSRLIPISQIEAAKIKRSLEAKLSFDKPGDILVINWLSDQGDIIKDEIKLSRYTRARA